MSIPDCYLPAQMRGAIGPDADGSAGLSFDLLPAGKSSVAFEDKDRVIVRLRLDAKNIEQLRGQLMGYLRRAPGAVS